jgi:hypothetical protein
LLKRSKYFDVARHNSIAYTHMKLLMTNTRKDISDMGHLMKPSN